MGKGKKKEPINLGHHEKLLTFATRISNGTGRFQSGQMGQTVNLLLYSFGGSNPSLPTKKPRPIWPGLFCYHYVFNDQLPKKEDQFA